MCLFLILLLPDVRTPDPIDWRRIKPLLVVSFLKYIYIYIYLYVYLITHDKTVSNIFKEKKKIGTGLLNYTKFDVFQFVSFQIVPDYGGIVQPTDPNRFQCVQKKSYKVSRLIARLNNYLLLYLIQEIFSIHFYTFQWMNRIWTQIKL